MIGSLELAAALLLAAAGLAKLVAPQQGAAMLRRAWPRVPLARPALRLGGAVEIAVALGACLRGDRWTALALGTCYLVFMVVAFRLMRRGQRSSCGCFGRADSPVGIAHVVLDGGCVGVAVAAAGQPPGALGGLLGDGVLVGVVGVGQAVLLAYLGFLSITALPALTAARRHVLEVR
jgi:hypothetical protein